MPSEESKRYKVIISEAELAKLERWGAWAKQKGVLDEYLAALKTIDYRLTVEPTDWGEPRYMLHHLGLEIRLGTFSMINVCYGVSRDKPLVFVKVFQFRGDYPHGRPLDQDEGDVAP